MIKVVHLYWATVGIPIRNWDEWQSCCNKSTGNDLIRSIPVIGEKRILRSTRQIIAGNLPVCTDKLHMLSFKFETLEENESFLRLTEAIHNYIVWYETDNGIIYGSCRGDGSAGIKAHICGNRAIEDTLSYTFVAKWNSRFDEKGVWASRLY